jgi:hypothetical protein
MTVTSPPPGIPSAPRLVGWIGGEPAEMEDIQLIAGGRSNLSYRLTVSGRADTDGYFKLAVVLEGIYARYSQHQTVGEGFEHEGLAVPTLVARAHQVLDADD